MLSDTAITVVVYDFHGLGCCADFYLPPRPPLHSLLLAAQSWKTALSWPTCLIQQMPTLRAAILENTFLCFMYLERGIVEQWKALVSCNESAKAGRGSSGDRCSSAPTVQGSTICAPAPGAHADLDCKLLIDYRGLVMRLASVVTGLGWSAGM
jgi:hypothetical protein